MVFSWFRRTWRTSERPEVLPASQGGSDRQDDFHWHERDDPFSRDVTATDCVDDAETILDGSVPPSPPLTIDAASPLPQTGLRLRTTNRISWMPSGWILATYLPADGGGTASLTIGCPDDFHAVRLGFANTTPNPWVITKAIGCASSSFSDYIRPTGGGMWTAFTFAGGGEDTEFLEVPPDAPTAITVRASMESGDDEPGAPAWSWTDWAPIRSVGPDPATGMRVLMLRALVPSAQTICFANSQLRKITGDRSLNHGYDCFVGGIKFNFDRVTDPVGSLNEPTDTWLHNQLANGSVFPIVQFLTRRAGIVGATTGDSHHQGTGTTEQMTGYLYRATTELGSRYVGRLPVGMINCAIGGLGSSQFFPRLERLLKAVQPSYVVLPGWTFNDYSPRAQADREAMDLFYQRLLQTARRCQDQGIAPILLTPLPRNAEVMTETQLEPWRALRHAILELGSSGATVLDAGALVCHESDGQFDATYLSQFSDDGMHPNETAHSLLGSRLIALLESGSVIAPDGSIQSMSDLAASQATGSDTEYTQPCTTAEGMCAPPGSDPTGLAYPEVFFPGKTYEALLAAAQAQTGIPPGELALKFENFGDDCEFGVVQRACGVEPLGLFRFSNPTHEVILRGVATDFHGFGDNAFIELDNQEPRREWTVMDPANGLRQHTHILEGDQPAETVHRQQMTRFHFLRRKIVDDIAAGAKIFVIKSGAGHLSHGAAQAIARALRRKGPAWLLWVEPGRQVGQVEILEDGLVRATIDRLTVQPNAHKFSLAGWLAVMSEAWNQIEKRLDPHSPLRGHATPEPVPVTPLSLEPPTSQ